MSGVAALMLLLLVSFPPAVVLDGSQWAGVGMLSKSRSDPYPCPNDNPSIQARCVSGEFDACQSSQGLSFTYDPWNDHTGFGEFKAVETDAPPCIVATRFEAGCTTSGPRTDIDCESDRGVRTLFVDRETGTTLYHDHDIPNARHTWINGTMVRPG